MAEDRQPPRPPQAARERPATGLGAGRARTALGGRTAPIRLRTIQDCVARLYRLELRYDVEDFLTSRRELVRALLPQSPESREEVVLLQERDGGELDISLFLDLALLERLAAADPLRALHGENLADFCLAVEGISHFVFLIWCAGRARQTSLFELELQAEVDKFVLAALLMRTQRGHRLPRSLHGALFERIRYHDGLDPASLARYRRANGYAGRYCRHLRDAYLTDPDRPAAPGMVDELYDFYRMPQQDKIRHIERRSNASPN